MSSKFDTLNDEFNVAGDIVQPEVVNEKIQKIKETSDYCLLKIAFCFTRGLMIILFNEMTF